MEAIRLTLGSKLELEMYNNNGEHIKPILVSQFETLLPDGTMEILAPIYEGRLYNIHRDTNMDVVFLRDGDVFKFLAVVLERKTSGNIHLLKIKPLSGEERYQRRIFFRFNSILDINYCVYAPNYEKPQERPELKKTLIKDLSGGGLCILLDEKPDVGWILEGNINIGHEVHFKGRILRVINVENKGKFNYEAGVEFTEITNRDRERIIKYIFNSQRKLLEKGWHDK